MRKLLLLVNIVCLSIIAASCQNSVQQKSDQAQSHDSVPQIDTTLIIQSEPAKDILPESGKIKDTTNSKVKGVPIIHSSPEQEKIDSIKKEKLKGKK